MDLFTCSSCNADKQITDFYIGNRKYKVCNTCFNTRKKKRCSHGREKCRQCTPQYFCSHNKQKTQCKICSNNTCPHRKYKYQCRDCLDSKTLTVKLWMYSSRRTDIHKNRFDLNNFITKDYCHELINRYPNCYYEDCNVELQYDKYDSNMASIERLDNSTGHIKSNVVLCCLSCNKKKKSNRAINQSIANA